MDMRACGVFTSGSCWLSPEDGPAMLPRVGPFLGGVPPALGRGWDGCVWCVPPTPPPPHLPYDLTAYCLPCALPFPLLPVGPWFPTQQFYPPVCIALLPSHACLCPLPILPMVSLLAPHLPHHIPCLAAPFCYLPYLPPPHLSHPLPCPTQLVWCLVLVTCLPSCLPTLPFFSLPLGGDGWNFTCLYPYPTCHAGLICHHWDGGGTVLCDHLTCSVWRLECPLFCLASRQCCLIVFLPHTLIHCSPLCDVSSPGLACLHNLPSPLPPPTLPMPPCPGHLTHDYPHSPTPTC